MLESHLLTFWDLVRFASNGTKFFVEVKNIHDVDFCGMRPEMDYEKPFYYTVGIDHYCLYFNCEVDFFCNHSNCIFVKLNHYDSEE